MTNVVDEVLASSPKYNIYDSNNNLLYENVDISLATTVTTQGTPLNKALFDSIQDDLNLRLLISSKSTQAQAEAGVDNTNYMTALRVKNRQQYLTQSKTLNYSTSASTTQTIFDFTTATGNIIEVQGYANPQSTSNYIALHLTGTGVGGQSANGIGATDFYIRQSIYVSSFYFRFDLASKTYCGFMSYRATGTGGSWENVFDTFSGDFTTLTAMTINIRGTSGTAGVTITQNY